MSTQPEKKASAGNPADKLLVVAAPPYGRAYEGALTRLERDRGIQIQECDTHMDAVTLLRKTDFAVLLCHSSTPEELVKQVGLLKLLAPQIKQKRLRVMATTAVKHESAATSLNFYGATEMLTEPISEKALQFKLERMARSLAQVKARAKSEAASSAEGAAGPDAKKDLEAERGGRSTPQLVRKPALSVASDFWLTAELEVKRIRDRWLIHLVGPSPDLGKWMRVASEAPGRQGTILWQWTPNEPDGRALYKEEGEWFFRGQRPEFQELEWLFIGVAPELFFKAGDKVLGVKIQTDERSNLLVARDSEASQALFPLVKDSLVNMGKKTFRKKKDEEDGEGEDLREKDSGAKKKKKLSREEKEDLLEVKEGPPLKLASDCWVIADRKPKRIAQRWVTRMLGPTPDHGRWVRMGASDLVWGWESHNPEADPFIKEKGTWVFRGLPPKFQDDRWLFVADKPGLAFMEGGKSLASKLAADVEGNLIVAKDSEQALAKLPVIEESLKKIFKSKAEQEGTSKAEGEEEKHGEELEEVLEAERKKDRGEPEDSDSASASDSPEDLDEDEIEISRKRKKRGQIGEEDDDELTARSGKPDRDEEDLEAAAEDQEDAQPEDAVAEEEGGRKRRRRRKGEESEELYAVQEGAGPGKELSIELDPEAQGKELEATQEGPGKGKELSARTEGADPGDELEAEGGRKKRKKGGSVQFEEEEPVDHGKVTHEKDNAEDLGDVTRDEEESGELGEVSQKGGRTREGGVTEEKPVRPEDAKGIRAPGPPGPTLSPLALAFLVAELVNDRTKGLAHGASRFCAYLSASCGGLQIELWCKSAGGWVCASKSEDAGKTHEVEASGVDQDPTTRLHGTDTLVTPVRFKGAVVGALVIHGNGTDGVKHDYAEAAARVACGMAFSLGLEPAALAA